MKLNMTIEEALAFADEWSRGITLHEGSQGWRVVCMLLAGEVRRLNDATAAQAHIKRLVDGLNRLSGTGEECEFDDMTAMAFPLDEWDAFEALALSFDADIAG